MLDFSFEVLRQSFFTMTKQPQFSIVIATHNRSRLLMQAIESVQRQSYPVHEIIIVSDGSTDDTAERVQNEYSNDSRVQFIEQENSGQAAARNMGVSHATGDWVGFLDDDDLYHRDKLQKTVEYLHKHPDCLAINNPVWFFAEDEKGPTKTGPLERHFVANDFDECQRLADSGMLPKAYSEHLFITGRSYKTLLQRTAGVMTATMVERRMIQRAGGFNVLFEAPDDLDFFLRIARFTEWHTLPDALVFTRIHGSQHSNTKRFELTFYLMIFLLSIWYGGRPYRGSQLGVREVQNELKKYGESYETISRNAFWILLRRRDVKAAIYALMIGRLLVPENKRFLRLFVHPTVVHYAWVWRNRNRRSRSTQSESAQSESAQSESAQSESAQSKKK